MCVVPLPMYENRWLPGTYSGYVFIFSGAGRLESHGSVWSNKQPRWVMMHIYIYKGCNIYKECWYVYILTFISQRAFLELPIYLYDVTRENLIVNAEIVCRTNVANTWRRRCRFVLMTYETATKNSSDSWQQCGSFLLPLREVTWDRPKITRPMKLLVRLQDA